MTKQNSTLEVMAQIAKLNKNNPLLKALNKPCLTKKARADINELIDYLFVDEQRNWEESDKPKSGHIYNTIVRVERWLARTK